MTTDAKTLALSFGGGDAVVTGAASGIGAATAAALMSAGIRTVRLDIRTPEPDPRHPDELQVNCAADVRDPDLVSRLREAGAAADSISYVVNCAGIIDNTGFGGVPRDAWLRCLEINLVGAYNVIDALTPALRQNTPAAVVNISSIEAARVVALSDPDPTPQYAASKAGLSMLTRAAPARWRPTGSGSTASRPGSSPPRWPPHAATPATCPRSGAPGSGRTFRRSTEIAYAAAFLLSDQAAYLTGSEVRVDGGFALT